MSKSCGTFASWLSNSTVNGCPAGAESSAAENWIPEAAIWTVVPATGEPPAAGDAGAGDPAAGEPPGAGDAGAGEPAAGEAPGEAPGEGAACVNSSAQQSGNGVASGAGLKVGSRQPVKVSTSPVTGSIRGSISSGSRFVYVWSLVARMKAIRSSIWM